MTHHKTIVAIYPQIPTNTTQKPNPRRVCSLFPCDFGPTLPTRGWRVDFRAKHPNRSRTGSFSIHWRALLPCPWGDSQVRDSGVQSVDRGEAEPLQGLPRERTALIGSGLHIHTMQPQVTGPPDDLSPRPSFFSLTEGPPGAK